MKAVIDVRGFEGALEDALVQEGASLDSLSAKSFASGFLAGWFAAGKFTIGDSE